MDSTAEPGCTVGVDQGLPLRVEGGRVFLIVVQAEHATGVKARRALDEKVQGREGKGHVRIHREVGPQ